jgi:hypothetical protein
MIINSLPVDRVLEAQGVKNDLRKRLGQFMISSVLVMVAYFLLFAKVHSLLALSTYDLESACLQHPGNRLFLPG